MNEPNGAEDDTPGNLLAGLAVVGLVVACLAGGPFAIAAACLAAGTLCLNLPAKRDCEFSVDSAAVPVCEPCEPAAADGVVECIPAQPAETRWQDQVRPIIARPAQRIR